MRLRPYYPTVLLLTYCYTAVFHSHSVAVLAKSQSTSQLQPQPQPQPKIPVNSNRRLGRPRRLDTNSNKKAAKARKKDGDGANGNEDGLDGDGISDLNATKGGDDGDGEGDDAEPETEPEKEEGGNKNNEKSADSIPKTGDEGTTKDTNVVDANPTENNGDDKTSEKINLSQDSKGTDGNEATTKNETQTMVKNDDGHEDEDRSNLKSIALSIVILVMIGGIGMLVKRRIMKYSSYAGMRFGGGSGGGSGVSDDDFTYGVSTVGGGKGGVFQHRHEAVPLAATVNNNDDEWGWEDGNAQGEIELGNTTTTMKETDGTDDLQSALALSLSDNVGRTIKRSSSSSSSKDGGSGGGGRKSLPMSRRGGSGNGTGSTRQHRKQQLTNSSRLSTPTSGNKSGGADSWDEDSGWGDDSSPTTAPIHKNKSVAIPLSSSSPASPIMNEIEAMLAEQAAGKTMITSLGKTPKKTTSTVKVRSRNNEEDIFASMGLSSIGRSSAGGSGSRFPAAAVSPAVSNPVLSSSTWRNSTPAAAQVTAGEDDDTNGSDWDDDLDDLLDD